MMTEISLDNLSFFAHHGITPEERKTGNKYRVDVTLQLKNPNIQFNALGDTVDYAAVYEIVKQEMEKPTELLEQITVRILDRFEQFQDKISKAAVSVAKYNPPIGGVCEKSTVRMMKEFK